MNQSQISVFRRGADSGLPVGLLMAVAAMCTIWADRLPLLAYVVFAAMIAVPMLLYKLQRRQKVDDGDNATFSALWMHGILATIYGSAIASLAAWLTITLARPEWAYEQVQAAIDMYNTVPEARAQIADVLDTMQRAVEQGALPKPIELVMNVFWLTSFSGSLLSAFTAALAGAKSSR